MDSSTIPISKWPLPAEYTVTTTALPSKWGHCHYCGLYHNLDALCPSIKEIEYYSNGAIKRITMKDK